MNDEMNDLTVLTTLYEIVSNEITRYRNYEWQITALIVGLFAGIIKLLDNELVPTLVWVLLILVIWVFGLWALHYVHTKLNSMRNRQRKIEHILSIHEPKRYLPDDFSIPEGWDKRDFDRIIEESEGQKVPRFWEGWPRGLFVISFMLSLSAVAVYALDTVWQKRCDNIMTNSYGSNLLGSCFGGLCMLAIFIVTLLAMFWVYRDAEARGKTGCLWVLLISATGPLGIIAYLVLRDREVRL